MKNEHPRPITVSQDLRIELFQRRNPPHTEPKIDLHRTYSALVTVRPTSEIHNYLSSLMYLAWCQSVFIDLLLSKNERFEPGNLEIYKNYLVKLMTYLEDWKMAQLERTKTDGKDTLRSFLALD